MQTGIRHTSDFLLKSISFLITKYRLNICILYIYILYNISQIEHNFKSEAQDPVPVPPPMRRATNHPRHLSGCLYL